MNESNTTRERVMAEELWLMYFNNYLFDNGIITESERNRMVGKIANRPKHTVAKQVKQVETEPAPSPELEPEPKLSL